MRLRMLAFDPVARTFHESSRLLTLRAWSHRRTIRPVDGGCEVEDRLEPRAWLAALDPVVVAGVTALFAHRHRRLRARYGACRPLASGRSRSELPEAELPPRIAR